MRNTHAQSDFDGMSLSRLLAVAGHVVAMKWQRLMGAHGLTPHGLAVLGYLRNDSEVTQRELARRCGIAPSTLNHTIDQLERAGWIERERHSGDRRLVRLSLTPGGRKQLDRVEEEAAGAMAPLLDHLTPDQEPAVRTFLIETVRRSQRGQAY